MTVDCREGDLFAGVGRNRGCPVLGSSISHYRQWLQQGKGIIDVKIGKNFLKNSDRIYLMEENLYVSINENNK